MDTSNVKESIDEKILRLLGLEDVFDLDYDTYLTLLKEAMVKGRMSKTTIPTEEIEALTNEYKRVKGKKNEGRFQIKKGKKINSSSFNIGKTKGLITASKSLKALPAAIGTSPVSKSLDDNISAITAAVVSIHETIKQQQNLLSGSLETDRRRREKEKGDAAENKLEKRFEGLKKIAEKVIAPVKSILDKIINFLVNVLLGRVVIKLLDWLADPKNASKVKSIIRFIGDWWPALLGAYVLFGTTFGKFVRGTVGMLGRFIFQIGKVAIPQLLRLIKSPLGAGVALFTAGATIPAMFPGTVNEQERKTSKAPGSTKDKIQQLQTQKANLNVFEKLQGKGSEIDEQISLLQTGKTKGYGFSGGGFNGFVSGEKGVDKVPAMLSDGEFVMSRGAVAKYGVDTLEGMNAAGGGTNKPKLISGVPHAAGGGLIGDAYEGVDRASGGNLKPVVNEIIRGLSSQYKWANDLARKTGVNLSGVGNNVYNAVMNEGVKAQGYLTGGGLQKDAGNLLTSAASSASGLYNQVNNTVNDPNLQKNVLNYGQKTLNSAKKNVVNAGTGILGGIEKGTSSKTYKAFSDASNNRQDKLVKISDKFVKNIPDGPFREMMDKGIIPIPSGNATMMRNLTFAKAMLGPLGKPFKIMSNKEVDIMRQKTIDLTAKKNGLITDPKTGQIKMNWNQEDINKGARGGGAYTDKLGPRGSSFNSTLGRFSASTEGKGNTLYTDDRYNFNKTVSEYAGMAKKGLLKGSMSDAAYYGASMAGRFAQDIGWLNQRALGSRIEIGKVKRPPAQIAKSKPVAKPVKPPAKPQAKVVYGPPVPSRSKGKTGGAPKSSVPNFTAGSPGMRSKTQTLGLMR
jgi:hypothetical protein